MGELIDLDYEREMRTVDDTMYPLTGRVLKGALLQDMIMEAKSVDNTPSYSEVDNALFVIRECFPLTGRQAAYLIELCENDICDNCIINYG